MPIDPSIALGVRQPQIESPLNALAQVLQLQSAQSQNAMAQYNLNRAQRQDAESNALARVLSGGVDLTTPEGQAQVYRAAPLTGASVLKQFTDVQKTKSEIGKNEAQSAEHAATAQNKVIGLYRDASQSITDPQSAVEFLRTMHTDPRLKDSAIARVPLEQVIAQIPTDPAQFDAWKKQFALGAAKFMELNAPKTNVVNTGGVTQMVQTPGLGGAPVVAQTFKNTQSPDNAATVAATMRGQNMVDARSRELNAQGKTQIVETPQGFVLVDKQTGQSRPAVGADGQPLKGKANDRVMTDSQAKANLFGTRMKESDRILTELDGKYSPGGVGAKMAAGEIPVIGGAAGYAGNLMLSDSGQKAEQAMRDFVNAVLRRESGAVISPSEFANAKQQYFPQPGDTEAVKQQKARNRQLAIAGMEAEVPGGFRTSPTLTNPGNSGSASGGWSIERVN